MVTTSRYDRLLQISPKLAFLLVSLSLGQLGDGLNIFQGIYLVGIGWEEGSVGLALSLMGLTSLIVQPWAGDWVDKTTVDRRAFLLTASIFTALSASSILLITPTSDHMIIYATKVVEGITSSFLQPCLAALTLACFGPNHFDQVMASNILWGHIGSVASAVLAGIVSFVMYPNIKLCFLVIGASALIACFFVQYLPQGDPRMGRGFAGKATTSLENEADEQSQILVKRVGSNESDETTTSTEADSDTNDDIPEAASYWDVLADRRSLILCFTGFFFHSANANVLLVLGEMMGKGGDGGSSRHAIPLTAGNIVTAQVTMAIATYVGDRLTKSGMGRKPLFLAGIASLPLRCALIILFKDAGATALMSTQILDGVAGGLMGLVQPYLIADITFGTGRFNVLNGLIASFFGMGATLSNYVGQMVVQKFDHVTSLTASLFISLIPVVLFMFMPETMGMRTSNPLSPRRSSQPDRSLYGSFE
ncbi:MFS-type transporter [Seminavis robusta]|uniref:MFS-type transporter n=1 Tax=Seminavis robusta TaxID=568900 RepID=A0A9N8HID7_9STRA|nr:MFS-type transporter [Seminavis robusta]|eukprot:Sro692_g188100.1 MFS-type transporter (478) ;mRNA; r:33613-35235